MKKAVLAITIGDPAGIGPEIILKALADARVKKVCAPIVVSHRAFLDNAKLNICEPEKSSAPIIQKGHVSAEGGIAAIDYLKEALRLLREGKAEALVTAPVSKEAIVLSGREDFKGHTEFLGQAARAKEVGMMMAAPVGKKWLFSVLATRHIPISQVSKNLTCEAVLEAITLGEGLLREKIGMKPRVVVAGLNPHAGENGLLGDEEKMVIAPAVRWARQKGISVFGPVAADAAFRYAKEGMYDLVVAMYHDQAMIPLKVLAGRRLVNITLGLPYIRTSPGHGTASDIAGKNKADAQPMIEAILMAARLCRR